MEPRYIAVEGPIGVGKTSLAELLARELNARLFLEKPEENPFLEKFYQMPREYAFQTQLFFLLARYQQQKEAAQQDLFQQHTVADYLFEKDRIFASVTLSDDELALYEKISALLNPRLPRPDLVIYLQAKPRTLLERISRRGRHFEKNIDIDYLEKLCRAYDDYFFYYKRTPLLVVSTDQLDFVNNRKDFEELLKEIKRIQGGTQYFVPLGSR